MDHNERESQVTSADDDRPQKTVRAIVVLPPLVFALTALAGMFLIRTQRATISMQAVVLIMAALAAVLAIIGIILHHILHWRRPIDRLAQTLRHVQNGQIPPDELPAIDGPLAGLVEQLQDILRDLRRQRTQIIQSDFEMRQRLAQKTDALERVISSLRLQANRDPLTGLYNRRMFDQHVEALIEQSRRSDSDLSLLMLDLDNFKLLNDTQGHAAGDQFLRSVGQIIRSSLRQQDLAFRIGGDEFAVVLPGAAAGAGESLAARLTSLIDALGKTYKLPRALGISAGLSSLHEHPNARLPELVQLADQRLYATKQQRKRPAA